MIRSGLDAARIIDRYIEVTSRPKDTLDLLRSIILEADPNEFDAAAKAARFLPRFVSALESFIDNARSDGFFLRFDFNSSGTHFIQGSCFCEPRDDPSVVSAKKNRANTIKLYERCRDLTPREFEILSNKMLKLLGVEKPEVTKLSADHGIDFYGRVKFGDFVRPSILTPGAEKNLFVWLVGQAKQYPNTSISTYQIRELVGSIELAKSKVFAGRSDPLDKLQIRICDPVFFLFFTTGKFTRDSIEILKQAGVIPFDGMQIGQFLADHGIGLEDFHFDLATFNDWLTAP